VSDGHDEDRVRAAKVLAFYRTSLLRRADLGAHDTASIIGLLADLARYCVAFGIDWDELLRVVSLDVTTEQKPG